MILDAFVGSVLLKEKVMLMGVSTIVPLKVTMQIQVKVVPGPPLLRWTVTEQVAGATARE